MFVVRCYGADIDDYIKGDMCNATFSTFVRAEAYAYELSRRWLGYDDEAIIFEDEIALGCFAENGKWIGMV